MEKEKVLIDLNAHVSNISYQLISEDKNLYAKISFCNITNKVITAIKFKAEGFNSFGDSILIDNENTFNLLLQDLNVSGNEISKETLVPIPDNQIRKLYLEEYQVCYSDGTVVSYSGKNEQEFELDKFTSDEQDIILALQEIFDPKVKYKPLIADIGWICTCGRFNPSEKTICSLCNHKKEDVISIFTDEGINNAVIQKEISDKQKIIDAENQAKEKKKANNNKAIKLFLTITAIILFVVLVVTGITMSRRKTFQSEEEMQEALQGTYTFYNDNGDAIRQVLINDNEIYYIYKHLGIDKFSPYTIEWNPHNGTFKNFEKWIVLNNGSLKNDGDIYKKGGTMSEGTLGNKSIYSDLSFSNIYVSTNSTYTVCTGTITNNSSDTYRFVQIKGSFEDNDGKVLDTDSTYAVGSEGLSPGESKTFEMYVSENWSIESCTVTIFDYEKS